MNAHADMVGGGDALVSLDPEELLATAIERTGLDDFGDNAVGPEWRRNFHLFMHAVRAECPLHLVGRMMTRTDILRALRNRLELVDLWAQRPELLGSPVPDPIFIVGAARSGTSILHELLALDPAAAVPTTWKAHHPRAAAVGDAATVAGARRATDAVVSFWHDVQPEYEAMHHNGGDLPTECIFLTVPTFLSDNWGGTHTVPSYDVHNATADHQPAYEWHRRTLQTLQVREEGRRWVLKAPSHLSSLRQLFGVYPDARVIQLHRDPARTLPSMLDLMGTLKWMRTDIVDLATMVEPIAMGVARLQSSALEQRADGTLPDDHFHDLRYADLLADPVGAIGTAYEAVDRPTPPGFEEAIRKYLAAKPRGASGAHRYAPSDFGLTEDGIRTRFGDYIERFDIPIEN